MQSTMTVLTVRDLRISFGKTLALPAVRDISFEIGENETLAVVGESGSGKSMCASTLLGLLPSVIKPTAGQVLFEGRNLLTLSNEDWRELRGRRIAMIFQEPMTALNPVIPIGDQIAETFEAHDLFTPAERRARTIELVQRLAFRIQSRS
jgi:peptide/nickel transport system ATP-binding protein